MSQFEANRKRVFSEQLKELVKGWEKANNKKLTQEQIGKAVFVTRETVSGWYNGKTYPPEETIKRLCAFFNVPEWYFSKNRYDKGWTEIDEKTHEELERICKITASKTNLSLNLIAFLKETPALADAIVSASWVDGYSQSLSPSVPLMPDKLFQFVSSSNVKVYPSPEVIYMLSVVQRDLIEYAQFLIQKWTKVINDAHDQEFSSGEITMGGYGWRTKTGKEFTPAERRFELEMEGRGSLSHSASILVDQYNGLPKKEQEAFLLKVVDMHDQIIRETVKSPKKREAYFRELEEDDT